MTKREGWRRADILDTDDWAHKEMVKRLRTMTPGARARLLIEACELGKIIHQLALERLNKEKSN